MGQFLTIDEVKARFAEPLAELSQAFHDTCEQWERAKCQGCIAREELYLNEVTAALGLATLRKFRREISGKLDDAITGIYRYRIMERAPAVTRKKRKDDKG